jgi:phosphoribosylpyrophosphate synthetase
MQLTLFYQVKLLKTCNSVIDELVVTDTIPLSDEAQT